MKTDHNKVDPDFNPFVNISNELEEEFSHVFLLLDDVIIID